MNRLFPQVHPRLTPAASSLVPGVVVDSKHDRVYLMRPEGGIESLDLGDGRVPWTSELADQPLFVDDDVLYARLGTTAPGLIVKSLKTKNGKPVSKAASQLLRLPDGIAARLDDALGSKLRYTIRTIDSQTYLTWEYIERVVSGVAPADGLGIVRQDSGAFAYRNGSFEATPLQQTSAPGDDWPAELKALQASNTLLRAPWQTGRYYAVAQQTAGSDTGLVLQRWGRQDGERLPDKTLFKGRALAVLAACDEQTIVVSVPGDRSTPALPYRLRYFALESGEQIMETTSTRSAAPFCIKDSRLLVLSQPSMRRENGTMVTYPLELVATDLATGNEVWRRAIRDTVYRGDAPPSN